jgi:succinate dehydrogenase / fumarate reductase cytochrome b subunit
VAYQKKQYEKTTYAARTMWWGGIILALFVIYHILHFTTGHLHLRGFQHGRVYANAVAAFQVWYICLIYIFAMGALCLHLYHGFWSAFQTLGVANPARIKLLKGISRGAALFIFLGYISVPVAIFVGYLS